MEPQYFAIPICVRYIFKKYIEGTYIYICIYIFRIHICVTLLHTQPGVADRFLKDVKFSVMDLMKDPSAPVEGKVIFKCFSQKCIPYISILDGTVWRGTTIT